MTDIANAASATPRRYQRVPFELAGSAPRRDLPDPTGISWLAADNDEQLVELFARAFSASVDPREVASIRRVGARELAAWMIHDAQAGTGYDADRGWWSIIAFAGVPAGLILPVVFTGCARGNLDEGTIYHIAVVPEHRGHGLGRLLLGRATDALLAHGVWQITTDTAAENTAMIRVFTALGYTRGNAFFVEA